MGLADRHLSVLRRARRGSVLRIRPGHVPGERDHLPQHRAMGRLSGPLSDYHRIRHIDLRPLSSLELLSAVSDHPVHLPHVDRLLDSHGLLRGEPHQRILMGAQGNQGTPLLAEKAEKMEGACRLVLGKRNPGKAPQRFRGPGSSPLRGCRTLHRHPARRHPGHGLSGTRRCWPSSSSSPGFPRERPR